MSEEEEQQKNYKLKAWGRSRTMMKFLRTILGRIGQGGRNCYFTKLCCVCGLLIAPVINCKYIFFMAQQPLVNAGFTITLRHTTLGRTPLDE